MEIVYDCTTGEFGCVVIRVQDIGIGVIPIQSKFMNVKKGYRYVKLYDQDLREK